MKSYHPSVMIKKGERTKRTQNTFNFATFFILFTTNTDDNGSQLYHFKSYTDALKSFSLNTDTHLLASIKLYFDNGGVELYISKYYYNDMDFEAIDFVNFLKRHCDNLMNLEVLCTPNLIMLEKNISLNRLKVMQCVSRYCKDSDRLYIADINDDIIANHLDDVDECVLYYPWFRVEKDAFIATKNSRYRRKEYLDIPASVIASGLHARVVKDNSVFTSIANKAIVSTNVLSKKLDKNTIESLEKEHINPVVDRASQGLRIWGINAFNTTSSSVNEMRVLKFIKRSLRALSKEYIFEPNSTSLHDKLFFKINTFLQGIWQEGILRGESQDDAFMLESTFCSDESRIDFDVYVAIAKPLKYIVIKFHRVVEDDIPMFTSLESN